MKNIRSLILPGIFLVIILAGAVFAYTELTKSYAPEDLLQDAVSVPQNSTGGSTVPETQGEKRQPAPDFTVIDDAGNEVSLSDFSGTPVVINFWATWCGPCQREMPYLQEAWETYGEDVVFLMVNLTDGFQDTIEKVRAFIDEAGYTFPVYYDVTFSGAQSYGVYSIPLTVFVDADGNVAASHVGALTESALADYMALLTEA